MKRLMHFRKQNEKAALTENTCVCFSVSREVESQYCGQSAKYSRVLFPGAGSAVCQHQHTAMYTADQSHALEAGEVEI